MLLTFVNTLRFGEGGEESNIAELWREQAQLTIIVILGFTITHIYKVYVKRNMWVLLPVSKLIARLLVSVLVLTLMVLIPFLFIINVANLANMEDLSNSGIVLGAFFSVALIISLWVAIYFSVQYFKNYRKSQVARLKQDALLKEATLNKLRSQLNPHFIFNSLNSIRALVTVEPEKARDSITALSNIFRKSLQLDTCLRVAFDEEMQIVKDYLQLEKIRFEERLNVDYDIEDEVYSAKVPPLMLQTLVENGIKHGISNLPKGGVLKLRAKAYEKSYHFEIVNSGRLIENNGRKGYGLKNTKERLELMYEGKASINIENRGTENVLTTLIIPKETAND